MFSSIISEAAVISFLGSLAGYLVYALILGGAAIVVRSQTGVVLEVIASPKVRDSPRAVMAGGQSSGSCTGSFLVRVVVIVCMGSNLRITAARF